MDAISENYVPKPNKGWVRVPSPLTLRSLALREVLKNLSLVNHPIREDKLAELKETVRTDFLPEFYPEMIKLAHVTLLKPSSLINLLHALPTHAFQEHVDLMGYYEGTECCKPDNSTNWIYGYIPDICIGAEDCKKLFTLFTSIDLSKLKTLALWVAENSLRTSTMPYAIAKAINLTKLVIRGDADDHLLRIIGNSCHQLRSLDISRSSRVSPGGLLGLVLQKPIRNQQIPSNSQILSRKRQPLAQTLQFLMLTSAPLGLYIHQLMAKLLNNVYLTSKLPEVIYQRPAENLESAAKDLVWNSGVYTQDIPLTQFFREHLSADSWFKFEQILKIALSTTVRCQLDVYRDRGCPAGGDNNSSIHVYAHRMAQYLVRGFFRLTKELGLTEMTIYWDTFQWDLVDITPLSELVTHAPNLQRLESRVHGTWGGPVPIFNNLTEIHLWVLDDNTIIDLLRSCPSLQIIDIKNVRSLDGGALPRLNHQVLLELMDTNPVVWKSVKEFMIRPTNLTMESVLELTARCPNLKRIGDLECWDVTEQDIRHLNELLFNSKSQCVLVVLSFPPPRD